MSSARSAETTAAATAAPLAHHFDHLEQQRESTSLAMWIFLVTEIMFFGGLFTAYAAYRSLYRIAFAAASHHLDIRLGATNTAVLLASSFTMAMAVRAAQTGKRRSQVLFLIVTMAFGLTFIGIKAVEYRHKFEEHLFPGPGFQFEVHGADAGAAEQSAGAAERAGAAEQSAGAAERAGAAEPAHPWTEARTADGMDPRSLTHHARIFFSIYFAMTGLHALHMIIGVGILAWLTVQCARGRYTPEYHDPVECSGLYWHFVDIVWIFLFPLLYLLGHNL